MRRAGKVIVGKNRTKSPRRAVQGRPCALLATGCLFYDPSRLPTGLTTPLGHPLAAFDRRGGMCLEGDSTLGARMSHGCFRLVQSQHVGSRLQAFGRVSPTRSSRTRSRSNTRSCQKAPTRYLQSRYACVENVSLCCDDLFVASLSLFSFACPPRCVQGCLRTQLASQLATTLPAFQS